MKIDRKRVNDTFNAYVARYNAEDEKIKLKIQHTRRVSALCERIAQSLDLSEEGKDLAWLLGMLHDIGRFEQIRRYGTFIDGDSVSHAGLGVEILFEEGRIRDYVSDRTEDLLIRQAIACHSDYRIPEGLGDREKQFCHILRDADKIDILRVNVEFSPEEIYNTTTEILRSAAADERVMEAFFEEHAVLRDLKMSPVDYLVGHISLVYELVYPESLRIVQQQGYLEKLMNFDSDNEKTREQFCSIRRKMQEYLSSK